MYGVKPIFCELFYRCEISLRRPPKHSQQQMLVNRQIRLVPLHDIQFGAWCAVSAAGIMRTIFYSSRAIQERYRVKQFSDICRKVIGRRKVIQSLSPGRYSKTGNSTAHFNRTDAIWLLSVAIFRRPFLHEQNSRTHKKSKSWAACTSSLSARNCGWFQL